MKAYELLSSKEKWCQRAMAKNSLGCSTPVPIFPPEILAECQWCALGASMQVHWNDSDGDYQAALGRVNAALARRGYVTLPNFNDNNTYEEVIELLKEADV